MEIASILLTFLHFEPDLENHRKCEKCARKPKVESRGKWSGEGRNKSATSLRTFYNASEHKSGDRSPPSAFPVAVKLRQSAAFQLKSEDGVEISKKESENSKIRVVRNDREKVRFMF